MIALLVIIIGVLLWWFTSGKLETAGVIVFAIGVFYLVGDWKGYSFRKSG